MGYALFYREKSMMSLYDRFKTLRESYYGISIDVDRLFGHIEQDMRCKEFIDEHFA